MIINNIKQIERMTKELKENLNAIDPITYTPAGRKQKVDEYLNAYNEEVYKIALKAENELKASKENASIKSFDTGVLNSLIHMIETYSLDSLETLREYIKVYSDNDFAMYCIKNALMRNDKLKNIAYEIEIMPSKNEIIERLKSFDPLERNVLKEYYIFGQSISNVALVCDISVGQVYRVKREALEKYEKMYC